jgi:hypothetical protein
MSQQYPPVVRKYAKAGPRSFIEQRRDKVASLPPFWSLPGPEGRAGSDRIKKGQVAISG